MTDAIIRFADMVPWWVWTLSAVLGIVGTISLAAKSYHRAVIGGGR